MGQVYVGSLEVGAEQVRRGMAWVYQKYAVTPALFTLENEARATKRGLWAEAQPVPPWEFRHGGPSALPVLAENAPADCGAKRYCREMRDCAEARFYFERCRLRSLDGDGDGVPYEALCR